MAGGARAFAFRRPGHAFVNRRLNHFRPATKIRVIVFTRIYPAGAKVPSSRVRRTECRRSEGRILVPFQASPKFIARAAALAAGLALAAPAALAGDCSAKEAEAAGQSAANLVRDAVEKAVAVEGKEMMNLTVCRTRGAAMEIEYKYNFMGPDGYYWVEGEGSLDGAGGGSVKFKRVSDKLKEAAAAKNVVLAAK
jgi:hypothetical protein